MAQLTIALIAFVGTHFLMSHPLRAPMVRALGAAKFQGVYTLISFATFGWAVVAFQAVPSGVPYWQTGEVGQFIATFVMLFASVLLAGSVVGNPALPQPGANALARQPARGVFAITRHPMMWSFALWAFVHLLVSPQPNVVVLTLAIAVLALAGSYGQDHKKRMLMGDAWRDWSGRTSFMPFGTQVAGKTDWIAAWPGSAVVGGGLLIWLLATWLHPVLGAPVAGPWLWFG